MPADTPAEKQSFEAFLAKVPDAPSSAVGVSEEPAAEAEAPLADAAPEGAAEGAASPPPARKPKSADPASAEAEPTTPSQPPDPALVVAALQAGDLDAIADLLGEDPALYDDKTRKWAAGRRKEAKLQAERDTTFRKAEAVVSRWAPVADLAQAIPTDPTKVFELLSMLTGEDPDALWLKAVRARGTTDPRVPALTSEVAKRDARLAELEAERTKAADKAFHETLRDEVAASHLVRKIDGWEAKVAEVLRESIDPDLGEPKLSVKQASDRVVRREREEYERRAKVFGGDERPAKRGTERAPERAAGASGAKVRKLTRDEWLAAHRNG
jgi:hypothetical protein